jgi:hypothetical protein
MLAQNNRRDRTSRGHHALEQLGCLGNAIIADKMV